MLHIIVPTCLVDENVAYQFMRGLMATQVADCRAYLIVNEVGVTVGLKQLNSNGLDVRVYAENRRIGFVDACNIGYRLADPANDDLVVLLNDDLVFDGDWLNPLVAAIRGGAAQAGPALKWVGRDGRWGNGDEKYQYLEGWCFMTTGAAIKKAMCEIWNGEYGGCTPNHVMFDPAFAPAYCEDMDFSIRIQQSGGTLKQVDLPIRHLRSVTYGNDRPSWPKNQKLLAENWDRG